MNTGIDTTRQTKNPSSPIAEGQHVCLGAYHQKLLKGRAMFHRNILHISRYILHQSLLWAAPVEPSKDPSFLGVSSPLSLTPWSFLAGAQLLLWLTRKAPQLWSWHAPHTAQWVTRIALTPTGKERVLHHQPTAGLSWDWADSHPKAGMTTINRSHNSC